jgi:hypothetical protein
MCFVVEAGAIMNKPNQSVRAQYEYVVEAAPGNPPGFVRT